MLLMSNIFLVNILWLVFSVLMISLHLFCQKKSGHKFAFQYNYRLSFDDSYSSGHLGLTIFSLPWVPHSKATFHWCTIQIAKKMFLRKRKPFSDWLPLKSTLHITALMFFLTNPPCNSWRVHQTLRLICYLHLAYLLCYKLHQKLILTDSAISAFNG